MYTCFLQDKQLKEDRREDIQLDKQADKQKEGYLDELVHRLVYRVPPHCGNTGPQRGGHLGGHSRYEIADTLPGGHCKDRL